MRSSSRWLARQELGNSVVNAKGNGIDLSMTDPLLRVVVLLHVSLLVCMQSVAVAVAVQFGCGETNLVMAAVALHPL